MHSYMSLSSVVSGGTFLLGPIRFLFATLKKDSETGKKYYRIAHNKRAINSI